MVKQQAILGVPSLWLTLRTNSVLVKAPSQARSNLVKALVAKLDQLTELPGNVHVVYLKNAEAVKLAATLRSIVTGESSDSMQMALEF